MYIRKYILGGEALNISSLKDKSKILIFSIVFILLPIGLYLSFQISKAVNITTSAMVVVDKNDAEEIASLKKHQHDFMAKSQEGDKLYLERYFYLPVDNYYFERFDISKEKYDSLQAGEYYCFKLGLYDYKAALLGKSTSSDKKGEIVGRIKDFYKNK